MSELSVGSLSGLAANSYVIDVASGSSLDLSNGATLPAGSIVQVVSTTKTDAFSASVTSPNETAITGLSASITPSSTSSKILVLASVMVAIDANGVQVTLNRDATEIAIGDSVGTVMRVTNGLLTGAYDAGDAGNQMANINFLDSPASISSLTYSINIGPTYAGTATRTVYVNRAETSSTSNTVPRGVSTITLMEVAGSWILQWFCRASLMLSGRLMATATRALPGCLTARNQPRPS